MKIWLADDICKSSTIAQSICTHYSCFENMGQFVTLKKTRSNYKAILSVRKQLLPEGCFGPTKYNNIDTFAQICLWIKRNNTCIILDRTALQTDEFFL